MIRLYGPTVGCGSFVRVTRGMRAAIDEAGLLSGFFPTDAVENAEGSGADASVGLVCGPPGALWLTRAQGAHQSRWLLLAANSLGIPPAVIDTVERWCEGLLSPSEWGAEVLRQTFRGPVIVCRHGVDSEINKPNDEANMERMSAFDQGEFRVLHVSSTVGSRKATAELLRAWDVCLQKRVLPSKARLVTVVHPAAVSELMFLVHELGLPEKNVMLQPSAHMPDDYFSGVLKHAHLVCQPSRAEGFGMVPLEARCCGTPVAATLCTGHSEHMQEGDPGVVAIEHGDDDLSDDYEGAMAPTVEVDAIVAALSDCAERWVELSTEAMLEADDLREQWSWQKAVEPGIRRLMEEAKHVRADPPVE